MNFNHCIAPIVVSALAFVGGCEKPAETVPAARDTTASPNRADVAPPVVAPDNSAKNKADATGETKTPMDQSQSAPDVKITADIRRAIMDDKAMSMNAQNCKIITEKSGMVTLRGVVNTQAEKDSIDAKAKAVAGVTNVDNQLEIKSN